MNIRRATLFDLPGVERVYLEIHDAEEAGLITTGWLRGVYPVRATAEAALQRGDLFVMEENNVIYGSALINRIQVDVYADAPWEFEVPDNKVCVLHTLVISQKVRGRGYGKQFVRFYEEYALDHELPELRIDTNARNMRARSMYAQLGYKEIAIVPTVFNGIPDVSLVLLEKNLEA
ncbi:MAG: GNAT family N-acetyltransferase [Oscillospiraceae bacterium]|nr:GNAT family N-acetyltransferase [Oscillospiraceae bacterium]